MFGRVGAEAPSPCGSRSSSWPLATTPGRPSSTRPPPGGRPQRGEAATQLRPQDELSPQTHYRLPSSPRSPPQISQHSVYQARPRLLKVEIADDEMEVGVGIHREPGRYRTKLRAADEVVDIMLDAVVGDLPFRSGDEVALMVNGLGGTPMGELYLLYGIAHKKIVGQGMKVFRSYVNEYCTSLEMAGASLSLLKVNDEMKELLADPADISARLC